MSKNKLFPLLILAALVVASVIWLLVRPSATENNDTEKKMEEAAAMIADNSPLPGGNAVNSDQVVVTSAGKPVQIDVMPNDPEAPKAVVVDKNKLSAETVKVEVGEGSFQPASFKVTAGAPVSLAFISTDKKVHVITFSDSALAALAFAVPAGQTKAMTFNAPKEPGDYEFHCDVPGHRAAGEVGIMTVK